MKILRQKIFFDYKKYAEKYGEGAAEHMRSSRSEAAKDLLSSRKIDKEILALRRDALKLDPNFDRSLLPNADLAEGSLKSWKKYLKSVEEGHGREKQIMNNFEEKLNNPAPLLSKKAKTRLGVGVGIAAATGLGYAAYKHYKDKKKHEKTKQFGQIGDRVQAGATLGLMTGVVPGAFLLKRAAEKNSKALAIAGLGTTLGATAIGAGVGLYGGLKDKYRNKKSYLALEQALKTSDSCDINNIIKLRKSLWKYDDTFGFSDYLKQKNSKLYNSAMNMDRSLGIEFFDIDVPEIDFCKYYDSSASPEKIDSLAFDNNRLWDFLDIKIRLGDDIYKFNAWAYNIKDKSFELYNWCHRSFGNNEKLVATCKSFSEFKNHLISDLQNVAKKPTISDERCWDNMVDYCEEITTKDQFIKVRKDLWKYIQQYISEIINIIKKL